MARPCPLVQLQPDAPIEISQTANVLFSLALMIHGGGHMTLSRKAIRPAQTSHLLEHDLLPISLDYRLCPEVNLIDGPMADVRDACRWVQSSSMTSLQATLDRKGFKLQVDKKNFVLIGWSTGGHLAMTTAWTTAEAGLLPPRAILNFYSPTEFESGGERKLSFPRRLEPAIMKTMLMNR